METAKRSLVSKLVEVMAAVGRVPKNGFNKFHNYAYAMEADIVDAVRGELAKRNVLLVPSVEKMETTDATTASGKTEHLVSVSVKFTAYDGESGETVEFWSVGHGQDPGDKGPYKATTGAVKYGLMKAFLIPTGDDPENDEAAKPSMPAPAGVDALKQQIAAPSPSPKRQLKIQDVPSGAQRTHDGGMTFAFGKSKGVAVSAMDAGSLKFYEGAFKRDLEDASKAQWHPKTTTQLAAVQSEMRFRGV